MPCTTRWLVLTSAPTTPQAIPSRDPLLDASNMQRPAATEPICAKSDSFLSNSFVLTPPATPTKAEVERKRSSIGTDSERLIVDPTEELSSMLSVGVGLGADPKRMVEHMIENGMDVGPLSEVPEVPRPFGKAYQLREELGYGAWSKVYSASEVSSLPRMGGFMPPSPPITPERPSRKGNQQRILAVKALDRRDGRNVLEREATILTYLHSHAGADNHLVEFLGFDNTRCSIIMIAVPLSLDTNVRSISKTPLSTARMFDPIIGAQQWTDMAQRLIDGLAFLQSKGCVHGDIKPANVLLQCKNAEGELTPLYCDFSSSHVLSSSRFSESLEEVDAVTTEYTAPELLRALRKSSNSSEERAVATFASDIFALGVTLLFAATGESPYSEARMEMQKTGMAMEGRPLDFARSSAQAPRVMKGRAVDLALKDATQQDVGRRISVAGWSSQLEGIAERWREKGWKQGGTFCPLI